ncbi:MAG: hypothetical protein RL758_318 [Pseudomonadota bacterium]|jgi:hypothetical protein
MHREPTVFDLWWSREMKGIAVSPDVRELIAKAYEGGFIDGMQKQAQSSVDRAVNRLADRTGDAMDEIAHRFAHRLALDLECVLARYQGPWYDEAWETLSQYRSEMNKLHEQVSPTFMGEPLIKDTP